MFNPRQGSANEYDSGGFCHRLLCVGKVNTHPVIGGDEPPFVLLHGFSQLGGPCRKMSPSAHSGRS
jgi:hypothetical protein